MPCSMHVLKIDVELLKKQPACSSTASEKKKQNVVLKELKPT